MKRLLALFGLVTGIGAAAQTAKITDPLDVPVRHYGFLLAFALVGGFASWYRKVKAGEVKPGQLGHLIGELAISAFAGMVAFMLCMWADLPMPLTAALVGMSGHMGARALDWIEKQIVRRAGAALSATAPVERANNDGPTT